MSPKRTGGQAYRAVAGGIFTRCGRDVSDEASRLLMFYGRLAVERRALGDRAGATHLAQMALELAAAMVATDDWRRAAAGLGRGSELETLRTFAQRLSPSRPA